MWSGIKTTACFADAITANSFASRAKITRLRCRIGTAVVTGQTETRWENFRCCVFREADRAIQSQKLCEPARRGHPIHRETELTEQTESVTEVRSLKTRG